MVDDKKLSPAMKIFAWRGPGAAGATARMTSSEHDIKPPASNTIELAADDGEVRVGSDGLSPAMKIFAWRGAVGAPAATSGTCDSEAIAVDTKPPSTGPESSLETGVSEVFAGDGDESADYTLRAWRDGELVKHLTLRLKKATALQSMQCFATNVPSGTDVALYSGLHEQAANIAIEKLVAETPAQSGDRRSGV